MAIRNLGAFNQWIDNVVKDQIPEKVNLLQKRIVFDLFRRLVLKSPVGNPSLWKPSSLPPPPGYVGGRFRGNWQITVTTPAAGALDTTAQPPFSYPSFKGLQTVWITNNVPYAERLEGGWSYRQAPDGIVAVSIAELGVGLR